MASSSSPRPRPPRPPTKDKPRAVSDAFRPRHPIDPFAAATVREPWFLKADSLPAVVSQARRDVLLVLGAPTTSDLSALLASKPLSNSLIIIATHQPPAIPHTTLPTVRVLRLKEPLAIEQAGAVRFVNVLEWAERVGRLWRKYGGYGAVELSEEDNGLEHLLPPSSILRFRGSHSTPPSPRASATQLSDPRASSSSQLTADFRPGRPRSISARILNSARYPSLPAADPSQRPFDALINFLPRDVSDKALLKQSILATTISRPFLISSAPHPRTDSRSRRKSFLSTRSTTSVYLPPTPPFQSGESLSSFAFAPTKAHLIHVLPVDTRSFNSFARSKLVQSLESFLISFAYPTSMDARGTPDDSLDRPRPYIMTSSILAETITASPSAAPTSPYGAWPSDCSLAELVLCGALDGDDVPHSGQTRALTRTTPRALLAQASDVVILAEDAPMPPVVLVSQSEPPYQSAGSRVPPLVMSGSTSSSSRSSSPPSPRARGMGPGSPLAKSEKYIDIGGLPTPPDSEESGVECEDISYVPRKQPASPVLVEKARGTPELKSKRSRWRFWKRSPRIAVSS